MMDGFNVLSTLLGHGMQKPNMLKNLFRTCAIYYYLYISESKNDKILSLYRKLDQQ